MDTMQCFGGIIVEITVSSHCLLSINPGSYNEKDDSNRRNGRDGCTLQ